MNGLSSIGRTLFSAAMVLFGLLYLFHPRGVGAAPGPPWTAETGILAWVVGAAFVVAGLCMMSKLWARAAAVSLAVVLLLRVLIVFLPALLAHLHDPGPWSGGAEVMGMAGAALVLAGESELTKSMSWEGVILGGRILFAMALVVVGVQHFLYGKFIATLIPAWIPGHVFWAYFVGVVFFAAALSIVSKVQGPLGASLLGLMFLLWVLVLHLPRVAAAPHSGNEWTSAFVALAFSGGSFLVAASLRPTDR